MNRTESGAWLALAGAVGLGIACATSGAGEKVALPSACARGVCATIVERSLSNWITVDVTAPVGASLHNAWVAEPGGAPCRGGRALNGVGTDAGVRMSGPLPLEASARLRMAFTLELTSGESLDLDVRSPSGPICLRVPFAPAADAGAPKDGSGG